MKTFEIFVSIVGVMMSFGYYPQAYRIWKTKSARDISLPMYIIMSFGSTVWFIYGIVLKDSTIIWGFVFGVIGSCLVLVLKIIYGTK